MTKVMRSGGYLVAALGIAALLALALGRGEGYAEPQARLGRAVQTFVQAHPGTAVPVIIQTASPASALRLGAEMRSTTNVADLPIAGAIAATLTAGDVERLARDPDVEFVSLDAPMVSSGKDDTLDASKLATAYPFAANAVGAWQSGLTGKGVTVAVIDSGLAGDKQFGDRSLGTYDFASSTDSLADENGHGTYVSGIIAARDDKFMGIAPDARLLSLKVSGRDGAALASDVITALQWTVDHQDEFDIRVVNISLNSSITDSYRQDPLSAAVEQAWFHGIVVVASAGNYGSAAYAVDHAPANDPYVITAGAFDDRGTAADSDDTSLSWSGYGATVDGYAKPDVLAPGAGIISTLAKKSALAAHGDVVQGQYIRLSGTSASAAIVSGAVALMLQRHPELAPDQVKARLTATGGPVAGSDAPRIDALAAATTDVAGSANLNARPNELIDAQTGDIMYDSVLWRSVLWRSVLWRNVLWRSVSEEVLWP